MAEFDALGDAYERSATELPFREHLEHHSVRQAVGEIEGMHVLDLGCGTGIYTRRLATWGAASVTGIDVSDGMLAAGRERERLDPVGVTYLHRDASRPAPEPDPALEGKFDLVLSVYVLCYARTLDELAGFFTTARRALTPADGRLLAVTLNPDYGRGTTYYASYGFTLSQHEEREGAPVTLAATLPGGEKIDVTAHWWSRRTYELAAVAAGFTRPTWTSLSVSAQGLAQFGAEYWATYLNAPQAVILDARVESEPEQLSPRSEQ